MDSTRHAGKVAIVTGAASGIGRATALRLANEGARVMAATSLQHQRGDDDRRRRLVDGVKSSR